MKLIFIRHWETTANTLGMLQWMLDTELSENGILQAKAVAKTLKSYSFDCIYTSQLQRAWRTAWEIASYHLGVPLLVDYRLAERSLWIFEWRIFKDIMAEYGLDSESTRKMIENHHSTKISVDLLDKKKSFLEEIKKKDYSTICVVWHWGTLYWFRSIMLWIPVEYIKCANTSIREYERTQGEWKEGIQNKVGHLSKY